jgi:hypothetical protein
MLIPTVGASIDKILTVIGDPSSQRFILSLISSSVICLTPNVKRLEDKSGFSVLFSTDLTV